VRLSEKRDKVPFRLAVTVTAVLETTAAGAVTVKPALDLPDVIVRDAGTVTILLSLESPTLMLLGAASLRLMVHDDVAGGVRLAGAQIRFDRAGMGPGVSASVNICDELFSVAVMVAEVLDGTTDVVTVKLTIKEPERTVTDTGTAADELLLYRATLMLLVGAALRVAVHDDVAGGVRLAGLHITLVSTGGAVAFSPKAWILSVPTKTTPRAIAGVLYLPPTFNSAGVLCQRILNVKTSSAYRIGCGVPGLNSDADFLTFATRTQRIAFEEPLLEITGDPGVSNDKVFS
jgi:hypothetical protein